MQTSAPQRLLRSVCNGPETGTTRTRHSGLLRRRSNAASGKIVAESAEIDSSQGAVARPGFSLQTRSCGTARSAGADDNSDRGGCCASHDKSDHRGRLWLVGMFANVERVAGRRDDLGGVDASDDGDSSQEGPQRPRLQQCFGPASVGQWMGRFGRRSQRQAGQFRRRPHGSHSDPAAGLARLLLIVTHDGRSELQSGL